MPHHNPNLAKGPKSRRRPNTKRQNVTLPEPLWDAVRSAADGPRGVSAWIEDAIKEKLARAG